LNLITWNPSQNQKTLTADERGLTPIKSKISETWPNKSTWAIVFNKLFLPAFTALLRRGDLRSSAV